jgi:HEAT repeat protein
MQRLASLLKVRPEEGQLVLLVGLLFLCIQAGQGMGDNAASALFFLRFGVDFLPYMYLMLGGVTFVLTLAYSAGLGRLGRNRFFQAMNLGLVFLLLIERLALLRPFSLLYPILWLTVSCMDFMLGTFTWNLASEVSDARQAKRLFPLFASAGILGSVLGNSLTGIVARLLGTDNLFIFYALLLGLSYFLTRSIAKKYFVPVKAAKNKPSLLNDLRSGYDFVRGSSLMKLISYASILFSILFFAIAFPFSKVVTASFPDEAGVAGFLGLFSGITTAVTFLVSLLLANRIYGRLGIVNSVFLMPLAYVFGFLVFASQYSLTGAVLARFSQLVVLSGIAGTAWSALFNVVPSQKRGQVLAFTNGVPSQVGVVLSGLLLVFGERVLTITQILWMGMLVTLVCGFMVWKMRAAYGQALIEALRAGRLEVFSLEEPAFTGLQGDAAALNVVTQALKDPKPTARRLAAEILGRMDNASAIPALVHQLPDPEPAVRAAVLRALGELYALSALDSITEALGDKDAEVRCQALVALTQFELEPGSKLLAKLEELLGDPSIGIRTQAVVALAKLGRGGQALPSLTKWLKEGEPALRIASLNTLGRVAAYLDGQPDAAPVLTALQDPSAAIRQAACQAAGVLKDPAAAGALAARLSDPDASVRKSASEALRRGDAVHRSPVLDVLDSKDELACDAALDALVPGETQSSDRLRKYAGEEIVRLRTLFAQRASLPSTGRAVALLRQILQYKIDLCESRLVKVVGLVGDPRTMDLVRKSLPGSNPEVRAAALEALETLGDKSLARGILSLLDEEPVRLAPSSSIRTFLGGDDRWLCALAIRAVQELELREFIPKLAELKIDPDALICESALETLAVFGEVNPMDTLRTISTLERVLLLREVPIFADLSPDDLQRVAAIAGEQWFPAGTTIFHQGEEGNVMFIIVNGHVRVIRSGNGSDQTLAQRGPGEFVGEMAILESAPRSATLLTQDEVRMLAIEGDTFKQILRERPEVSLAVLSSVSRRLREMAA